MAMDFPSAGLTVGQLYPTTPVAGQPTYIWDGAKWTTIGLPITPAGKIAILSDGTVAMAAMLTLAGLPSAPTDAADKAYIDAQISAVTSAMPVLRGYLGGCNISASGSTATFTVSAGVAAPANTLSTMMSLFPGVTKTFASVWTPGNNGGALDTGSTTAATWYHVYVIMNPTSGAVDVLASVSASSPTLPSGYTLYRRIGSVRVTGSTLVWNIQQYGDKFLYPSYIQDYVNGSIGTTVQLINTTVPYGVPIEAEIVVTVATSNTGAGTIIYYGDSFMGTIQKVCAYGAYANQTLQYLVRPWVTGSQFYCQTSVAMTATYNQYTYGYLDLRGRFT